MAAPSQPGQQATDNTTKDSTPAALPARPIHPFFSNKPRLALAQATQGVAPKDKNSQGCERSLIVERPQGDAAPVDTERKRKRKVGNPIEVVDDAISTNGKTKPKAKKSSSSLPSSSLRSSSSSLNNVINPSPDVQDDQLMAKSSCPPTKFQKEGCAPPAYLNNVASPRSSRDGSKKEDAIVITESTPSPVKLPQPVRLANHGDKPTHSFFQMARDRNQAKDREEPLIPVPISVDADVSLYRPDDGKADLGQKSAKVHSFFGLNNSGRSQGRLKDGWGKDEMDTPLPSSPWPNHLGGHLPTDGQTSRSARRRPAGPIEDQGFWNTILSQSTTHHPDNRPSKPICPVPIPPSVSSHPAFTSIPSKHACSSSNRAAWADLYRPLRSAEVLGNEREATYLRDWLSALTVGGHNDKGLKVIRKAVKKPRAALLEGFIVDDMGLHGGALEEDNDRDEVLTEEQDHLIAPLNLAPRPNEYPALSSRLTNLVILHGPPGSGKSAAVHSCAHELGWEVFEVYPGMGKRTGPALMRWVGDLGKNHIVPRKERGAGKKRKKENVGGTVSFFGNRLLGKQPSSQGLPFDPIDIDSEHDQVTSISSDEDENKPRSRPPSTNGRNAADRQSENHFKQSMILIDEADILFEEEGSFWPAVISLVSESKRPVVITCNDHRKIPVNQLPVQAMLRFEPPPSHLILPYLQAIVNQDLSTRHSRSTTTDVRAVYDQAFHQTPDGDVLADVPLAPNGNERIAFFDMRRALTQLQLGTETGTVANGVVEKEENAERVGLFERLEARSFADAWIDIRGAAIMELTDIDRTHPTPDDEIDSTTLFKPGPREEYPVLASGDRSAEMAEIMSGGELPMLGDLGLERTRYIRSTLPILDPLIPLTAPLLPSPTIFLYTLPAILAIFDTDDAEEAAVERGEERTNAKTGRPVRRGAGYKYVRWLDLEGAEEDGRSVRRLKMAWA